MKRWPSIGGTWPSARPRAVKENAPGHVPAAQRPDATFLPALIADILQVRTHSPCGIS